MTDSARKKNASGRGVMYSIPADSDVLISYATLEGRNTDSLFGWMFVCVTVSVPSPFSLYFHVKLYQKRIF
jgi:hypothetical protein